MVEIRSGIFKKKQLIELLSLCPGLSFLEVGQGSLSPIPFPAQTGTKGCDTREECHSSVPGRGEAENSGGPVRVTSCSSLPSLWGLSLRPVVQTCGRGAYAGVGRRTVGVFLHAESQCILSRCVRAVIADLGLLPSLTNLYRSDLPLPEPSRPPAVQRACPYRGTSLGPGGALRLDARVALTLWLDSANRCELWL